MICLYHRVYVQHSMNEAKFFVQNVLLKEFLSSINNSFSKLIMERGSSNNFPSLRKGLKLRLKRSTERNLYRKSRNE